MTQPRIGIYAGTFDPVHAGHIAFALQAMEKAELDRLYFLPERRPRRKTGVEHFGHRVAMLKRATAPHPQFGVIELVDISFSVERTLPKLLKQFNNAQLVMLFGSDIIPSLTSWPNAERLLRRVELVVGLRSQLDQAIVQQAMAAWPRQPRALMLIDSYAPDISSSRVRAALYQRKPVRGLLSSVARYSDQHWLYVSLA